MDIKVSIKEKSNTLFNRAGVNRAVLWHLLYKIWTGISLPVSVLLIANRFSPELQGYYYTFAGVLSFQLLIELGLGNVIMHFASHEWSKLSLENTGYIHGDPDALSRLQSLAQFALRWYVFASLILMIVLGMGGYLFFSQKMDADINWTLPWFTLCILTGGVFCLTPIWSLLEGCNQVSSLYAYRFWQSLFSSLFTWGAIIFGARLWTASVSSIVSLICALIFLSWNYPLFFKALLLPRPSDARILWFKDIWPFQWRVTVSWLIGSFTFILFTPVLFHYHGSVIAGQMGMTLTIIGSIAAFSNSWLTPKVPQFGIMVAMRQYEELDRLFWRITKTISIITIIVTVSLLILIYILNEWEYPLAIRILPPIPAGLFILSQAVNAPIAPIGAYLRAHKKEPLMPLSALSGLLVGISAFYLGKHYAATGMAVGYLLINIILFPFTILIWHRCRKQWHLE